MGGGWTVEGAKNTPYGFGIHFFGAHQFSFFLPPISYLSSYPPPSSTILYYIHYLYNIDKELVRNRRNCKILTGGGSVEGSGEGNLSSPQACLCALLTFIGDIWFY
jgi:hypothetical protein